MKKITSICSVLVLLILYLIPISVVEAASQPERQINVIYDDSISMIRTDAGVWVDTWSQAKYAMEVFAAMLGERDSVNIYTMSDFKANNKINNNAAPRLSIIGSNGMEANVAKTKQMVKNAGDTPFSAVKKAYNDLCATKAEEKWLVVLTDGEFEGVKNGEVSSFFKNKAKNVNVVFLGMGANAEKNGVMTDENNKIFAYYTKSNSEILTKITDICTRIYNSHKINVDAAKKTISSKDFDGVPMKELTIFAQGKDVKINGITRSDGTVFNSLSTPVEVKVDEGDEPTADGKYKQCIRSEGLHGSIATFSGDFAPGDYTFDVSGAETIEVYYKPNIAIAAYLTNSKGEKVENLSKLEAGDYTINFGLVKAGTEEPVGSSSLLGDVEYSAKVENNGIIHDKEYKNGDKISLAEGDLKIDIVAEYLDYNTVKTSINHQIYKNKALSFESLQNDSIKVTKDGIDASNPMKLSVKLDGKEPTEEQWNKMEIPKVKIDGLHSFKIDDFVIEKSEEKGIFYVTPVIKGKPSDKGAYEDCDLKVSYDELCDSEIWRGENDVTLKMTDTRSFMDKYGGLIGILAVLAAILIIVLGYTPMFKHYLPKKLKSSPKIVKRAANPVIPDKHYNGKLSKNLISTFIPYKAQTGVITFTPPSVPGIRPLKVKGIKGGRMAVTNLDDYRNKPDIKFRGNPIINQKTLESSSGLSVTVSYRGDTYSCQTNR